MENTQFERQVLAYKKTVTSAELKALVATDVEIVPAPGAGKVIVPLYAILTMRDANGGSFTAYTWANTDHGISLGSMAFDSDGEAQALIEASSRYTAMLRPPAGSTPLTENQAVVLSASGTGEPATGDGVLDVEVVYSVHDVSEL